MRRMSFALTKEQILNRTKFVTRRNGWDFLMPGDLIQPVEKCMGLKKGEKQVKLGNPIRVVAISSRKLHQISKADLILEGLPEMTPEEFIAMYCKANKCDRQKLVNRIQFEYTEHD